MKFGVNLVMDFFSLLFSGSLDSTRRMTSPPHTRHCFAITRSRLPRVGTFESAYEAACVTTPSLRAAFVLFPRQSFKTFEIVVRWTTLRSVVSSRSDFAPDCRRKWLTSTGPPSQRIAARSKTLRSSRTLPGHSCWSSAARASRVSSAAGRPKDLPISCRKLSLSGTMSEARSRSGGMRIDHVDAVEEVLAHAPVGDQFRELDVGRRDHPHVDLDLAIAAEPFELAFLQDPQQLGLHVEGDLSPRRGTAPPAPARSGRRDRARPGEGAALVAEQLALEQVSGKAAQLIATKRPDLRFPWNAPPGPRVPCRCPTRR